MFNLFQLFKHVIIIIISCLLSVKDDVMFYIISCLLSVKVDVMFIIVFFNILTLTRFLIHQNLCYLHLFCIHLYFLSTIVYKLNLTTVIHLSACATRTQMANWPYILLQKQIMSVSHNNSKKC